MKIYDITNVYGVYDKQTVAGRPVFKSPSAPKSDKLSLSKDAIDFQSVMKGLRDAADIRADKVSELSQKYETGSYAADTRDIAESLFKSGLFSKKA